ncbi:MAG TPA: hypothetical protein ENN51_08310, partial [candidate division WOR-3 bacterium]|nr:hypothetical protein [candidate division WOR-3 bacterium]
MSRAPLHPFLFACAPVLILFAHNARRIALGPGELLLPLALVLALALAALLLLRLLLRDSSRAALGATLTLLLFFG